MICTEKQGKAINIPKGIIPKIIWTLFGNEDDGYIGDKNWNPEQVDSAWIRVKWWVRNPLHNLVFYVIGCADKDSIRCGTKTTSVFANEGWNFAYTKTSRMYYPFISYYGSVKFYIGWRERGNFGIKLTANSSYKGVK